MDPWFLVALVASLAAAVLGVLLVRARRTIGRVHAATGGAASDELHAVVARQRRELEAASVRESAAVGERDELLAHIGSGILRIDADLRVLAANPAAHTLLDRPPGSLPGRTVMEAFLDASVEGLVRSALASGAASGEISPAGPDGPTIAVAARRSTAPGTWIVLDDVSELRRLQRIRTEFIDNLSHELRTPLTTVSLLAETLARDADAAGQAMPERVRERIGKIEVETGHLVQMVSELMDLSRIESGGPLEFVDGLDLGAVTATAAERLHLFAERQGVELKVEVAPGLPAVRGDAARLGQVVLNLVHNAVKFSPDGGSVVVRAQAGEGEVVVSVADHGIGIPSASLDRVFERFYKVDRARLRADAGGGTGLGLAIARHVIQQHGGRIGVESREGVGSTFTFAIPVPGQSG